MTRNTGCPWCAAPRGHECPERDYWLAVDDSELEADVEKVRGRRVTEEDVDW